MDEQLQRVLTEDFDLNELSDLCFRLEVDKDDFPQQKNLFIIELIGYLKRRGYIRNLINQGRQLRPNSDWPDIPETSADRIQTLKLALPTFAAELCDIFTDVFTFLKKLEQEGISESDEALLQSLEEFTQKKLSQEELISHWSNQQLSQQNNIPTCNFKKLADHLQHGEIALFLGNQQAENLVSKLAEKANYNDFRGTFSEICEYLENESNSRQSLLREIGDIQDEISQSENSRQVLYTVLSKIKAPLLLISAAYDSDLETQFQQQNKPFKLISYYAQSANIGTFLIQNSATDKGIKCTAEDFSTLELMENGFSLIFWSVVRELKWHTHCLTLNNARA